jgi:hypothetical protein
MRDENDLGRAGKGHRPLISKGGLSRRQIMKNAGAFGVVGGLMNAYTLGARAAGYDPKKYAGTKLSILMTATRTIIAPSAICCLSSRPRPASSWRSPRRPWGP